MSAFGHTGGLSRRSFVQGASLSALAVGGTSLLSACGTDSATVEITISAVNDAPVNTVPGAQTTNEDTGSGTRQPPEEGATAGALMDHDQPVDSSARQFHRPNLR